MLEALYRIEWRKLTHAYGNAGDVPGMLLLLVSPEPAERDLGFDLLNERLLREIRDKKQKKAKAGRERLNKAVNKAVRAVANRDGSLDDSARPALAEELVALGVSSDDVQAILAEIPKPMPKTGAAPDSRSSTPATRRWWTRTPHSSASSSSTWPATPWTPSTRAAANRARWS